MLLVFATAAATFLAVGGGRGECGDADALARRGIPAVGAGFERLVVHLHYYESPEYPRCKIVTKRTNLAVFVRQAVMRTEATYVVTASSRLPNATDFFASIGVEPWGESVLPASVRFVEVENPATDLCPRAKILETFEGSHYLFLNDGARGPFGGSDWTSVLASPFAADARTRLGGVVAACKPHFHIQSWAVVIDARVKNIILERYRYVCEIEDKLDVIMHAEVGVGPAVLEIGATIGALWPPFYGYSRAADKCLRERNTPTLIKDLHSCENVFVPSRYKGGFHAPRNLSDVVFTKFGGDVMPYMPPPFKIRVADETAAIFGKPRLAERSCYL